MKHPRFLSLIILFITTPSLFSLKSSKLLAIVNLVKGLYSIAVKSNFLNGKINFSIVSSLIFISIILGDILLVDISNPDIFSII